MRSPHEGTLLYHVIACSSTPRKSRECPHLSLPVCLSPPTPTWPRVYVPWALLLPASSLCLGCQSHLPFHPYWLLTARTRQASALGAPCRPSRAPGACGRDTGSQPCAVAQHPLAASHRPSVFFPHHTCGTMHDGQLGYMLFFLRTSAQAVQTESHQTSPFSWTSFWSPESPSCCDPDPHPLQHFCLLPSAR